MVWSNIFYEIWKKDMERRARNGDKKAQKIVKTFNKTIQTRLTPKSNIDT